MAGIITDRSDLKYNDRGNRLTLTAALIGATSLIFAAKGNVWAQILMIFLLCTGICVKRYCIDYFVGYGIYQRSVIFSSGSKFHDLFPK